MAVRKAGDEGGNFLTEKRIVKLLVVTMLVVCCWSPAALAAEPPNLVAIDVFTTNDVHGALVESGKNPGMAKFATFYFQQRNRNPYGSILVSAGDMFQGSPDSNLLYGKTMVEVLNVLEMDAMTLGNHEFDWGLEKLAARVAESKFPYVSANVFERDGKGRLSFVKPFVMLDRLGIKIAVIGIVTPETAFSTGPKIVEPFEFRDPATVVREYLPQLRKQGADLVIVLSHLAAEQNPLTGQVTGDAADLAVKVAGIDAVVSGHSHKLVAGKVNGIPVVQANYNARALGKISLVYSRRDKQVLLSSVSSLETPLADIKADPGIQAIIDKSQAEVGPVKNVVLGRTVLDLSHDRYELSVLGQWSSDVFRQATGAEIAFQNGGGLRTSIPAGTVTMGNLYEVMPFDNTLVTMELTGEQVLQVLNHGINGKAGTVQFSGLNVTIDSNRTYGSQLVRVLLPDGRPLDPSAYYKVVTNDFMAAGGDEFVMLKAGRNRQDTFIPLRDAVAAAVKKAGVIQFRKDDRMKDLRGSVAKPAA